LLLRTPTIFSRKSTPRDQLDLELQRAWSRRTWSSASPAIRARVTTLVNDVEHIESQSLNGIAV